MKKRIAVYGGSFDPPTRGHLDIIAKALKLFDEIIVVIAVNSGKSPLFSLEERKRLMADSIRESLGNLDRITITALPDKELLVKYAREAGAVALVRSMRTVTDFEFELKLAAHNKKRVSEVETIFIRTDCALDIVSSSDARELAKYNGRLDYMATPEVEKALREKFA